MAETHLVPLPPLPPLPPRPPRPPPVPTMPFALKFSEMKHYSIVGEARGDNDRECRDAATQAVCGRTTCMHTICANKHEPTPSSICVGTVFVYTCFQVYCYHYSFHIQMYSTR